jgi:anti-anti-sigma factor
MCRAEVRPDNAASAGTARRTTIGLITPATKTAKEERKASMNTYTLYQRSDGTVIVMQPGGYLDNVCAERIADAGEAAFREGCRRLVMNCSDIRFISSVAISILMGLVLKARDAGCSFCFTNVSKVHQEVFAIVGITPLAPVFNTEREAVRELAAD